MQGKRVIILNTKDNPSLLASNVKKGDIGTITMWHRNLNCGNAYINTLGCEMPVTAENVI